jgi:hypothetical protein
MQRLHRLIILATAVLSAAAVLSGCTDKGDDAQQAASTPAQPAAGGGTPAGPDKAKVSTGADPQKAPPYPGMYGAPK